MCSRMPDAHGVCLVCAGLLLKHAPCLTELHVADFNFPRPVRHSIIPMSDPPNAHPVSYFQADHSHEQWCLSLLQFLNNPTLDLDELRRLPKSKDGRLQFTHFKALTLTTTSTQVRVLAQRCMCWSANCSANGTFCLCPRYMHMLVSNESGRYTAWHLLL